MNNYKMYVVATDYDMDGNKGTSISIKIDMGYGYATLKAKIDTISEITNIPVRTLKAMKDKEKIEIGTYYPVELV